jgi:hypothetical protein
MCGKLGVRASNPEFQLVDLSDKALRAERGRRP